MIFLKKSDIISAFDKPFRHIQFHREDQPLMNGAANGCGGRQISPTVRLKAAGKVLNIYVAPGLPNTTSELNKWELPIMFSRFCALFCAHHTIAHIFRFKNFFPVI